MNEIHVYTDGSWNNQTKHMGFGIYAKYKSKEIRLSEYIGLGTNNIAELMAIYTALVKLKKYRESTPVIVYTDSKYCIGVCTQGWKAKANKELINDIKRLIGKFRCSIKFKWVRGHSGNPGNIIADKLALAGRKSGEI